MGMLTASRALCEENPLTGGYPSQTASNAGGWYFVCYLVLNMLLVSWDAMTLMWHYCNATLRLRQNGRHFADDIFKCIFMNENVWFPTKIWLKFVPKGLINKIPSFVRIMAWRCQGDRSLSEPMVVSLVVSLLTHIGVTRPQWVDPFLINWFFLRQGAYRPW